MKIPIISLFVSRIPAGPRLSMQSPQMQLFQIWFSIFQFALLNFCVHVQGLEACLIAALTLTPQVSLEEKTASPASWLIDSFSVFQFQGARDPGDEQASAEPEEEEAHLRARGQQTPPVAGWRGGGAEGQMQLCCSGERAETSRQFFTSSVLMSTVAGSNKKVVPSLQSLKKVTQLKLDSFGFSPKYPIKVQVCVFQVV